MTAGKAHLARLAHRIGADLKEDIPAVEGGDEWNQYRRGCVPARKPLLQCLFNGCLVDIFWFHNSTLI